MMKIKNTILLLVMMVLAPKAWAAITGDGSVGNPYVISSTADWETFAADINGGTNTYSGSGKYVKLGADIVVTTLVGTSTNMFQGDFDGNGHKLIININSDEEFAAPFRYAQNVTIHNLMVEGTIKSTKQFSGGLFGKLRGNSVIRQCYSRVNFDVNLTAHDNSSIYDFIAGGFVGMAGDPSSSSSHTLNMYDCLYDGTIASNGTYNDYTGAFVSICYGTTFHAYNSLSLAVFINIDCAHSFAHCLNSTRQATNSYFLNGLDIGGDGWIGTLTNETDLTNGTVLAGLQTGHAEEIWVQDALTGKPILKQFKSPVSITTTGSGRVVSSISGSTVTLTVTPDEGYFLKASDLKVRLSVNGGNADARRRSIPVHPVYETVTNHHNGTFTFTLPDKDYEYTANVTAVFKPVTVTLSTNSLTYNATVQKPVLTVTFDGSTLTTSDYLATSSGESKDAGDYTITISGQGDYLGTTAAYPYTITPKEVGLTWSTPQTFEYDGTAKSLTATATGVESGDVCTVTVVSNSVPYYGYTATAGHQRPEYSTLIRHLVDNDLTTKWCPEWGTNKSGVLYVEFHTDELIYPIGYTFYTGGDTSTYPSRNPRSWRLLAKKTENEDWTPISTVEDNYSLEFANIKPYDFNLDVVGESYMYFRFEVSEHRDDKTDNFSSRHQLQLQDLHLNVPDNRNVGTHTMTATALSNPNYVLPEVKTQTITITPKEVSLTWTNTSLTYNGSAQKPTATAGDLITGDECTVTVSGEQTNANSGTATYTATASALSNNNYKLPDDITQSFTISPKTIGNGTATPATDITLTGIDNNYVYTGSAIQPTVTLAYSQLPDENKTVAASGNYTVSYTDADHDNRNVAKGGIVTVTGTGNYTGSIVKTFTITQKPFDTSNYTISAIPNQTYNGTLLTPVVTLHDNTRNIDLTQGTDFSVTQHKDAGTHTVTIEALENYQASLTADFTIDPKEVGLEWQETRSFVYDGNAKTLTATATGLVGDDVCTVTVNYDKAPYFGSGKYTATRGSACYYLHLPQHLVDGDTLNTKWCPYGHNRIDGVYLIEFNTAEPIFPISYKLYNGGDAASFPTRIPKSWALKARKTTNDAWTTIASVTNDTRLEAINNNATGYRGYEYNLDAAGESYQYYRFEVSERHTDYTGSTGQDEMQLNELVLLTYGEAPIEAGEHTAYATALSNSNYKLPVAISQTFEITQRPVTLMWTDTGLVEDTQLIYNGSAQKPTATAGNVVAGDECDVTVSGEQTNANTDATPTYTATAASLSNANYALPTETTQSYKIYPKTLTAAMITPDATTIDYTGNVQKPAVTVEDLVESSSIITVDDYTVGDGNTDPGSYTLTVTGIRNYTGTVPVDYKIVYPLTFGTKYVTFYSPFDLALPTGMTAYTVTTVDVEQSQVTLTAQPGIKADVPMVLMGTASTDYKLEAATSVALNGVPHSQFVGRTTVVDCTTAGTIFVLQTNGDAAEFVRAKTGTIPARKCYLDLSTAGARIRSLMVVIGDGTTSLRGLEENGERKEKREMWYSLDGRKLDGMPQKKGLYIHNGQKVVIK